MSIIVIVHGVAYHAACGARGGVVKAVLAIVVARIVVDGYDQVAARVGERSLKFNPTPAGRSEVHAAGIDLLPAGGDKTGFGSETVDVGVGHIDFHVGLFFHGGGSGIVEGNSTDVAGMTAKFGGGVDDLVVVVVVVWVQRAIGVRRVGASFGADQFKVAGAAVVCHGAGAGTGATAAVAGNGDGERGSVVFVEVVKKEGIHQ